MTPAEFIDKWSRADRTERQAAQEHFNDLCRVLGEPTPNDVAVDPDSYTFEKGVSKTDGRAGFADVWRRGAFGWEYKKDRANLDLAYQQLAALFGGAGKPAAPRRLRHQAVPHLHQLDQHGSGEARISAGRPRAFRHARAAQERLSPSRAAAAAEDPRAGHQGRRQGVFRHRRAAADEGPRAGKGRALPQPHRVLPVRRGREPAAGRPVQAHARHAGAAPCRGARAFAEDAVRPVRQHARRRQLRHRSHPAFQRRPVQRRRGVAARRRLARHAARRSPGRTGRRSIRPSSARCSSASSIPTSARRSARTTPIPRRS